MAGIGVSSDAFWQLKSLSNRHKKARNFANKFQAFLMVLKTNLKPDLDGQRSPLFPQITSLSKQNLVEMAGFEPASIITPLSALHVYSLY